MLPAARPGAAPESAPQQVSLPQQVKPVIDDAPHPGERRTDERPGGRQADGPQSAGRPCGGAWLLLTLPMVLTALVVSIGATVRPLWQDELATWWAVTLPTADFNRLLGSWDLVFLPYYLFMRGWVALFGSSVFALRLPSMLAMVAAAGAVTMLGRRLWGTRGAVAAGVLFALVPAVTRYAHEGRPYAFVLFGAVLSTLLLLRAAQRPSVGRWTAYAVVLGLTGCLHLISLALLLAHGAWVWQSRRVDGQPVEVARRWLVTAAVAVAPAVVLGGLGQRQQGQVSWINTPWSSLIWMPGDLIGANKVAVCLGVLFVLAMLGRRHLTSPTVAMLAVWAFVPILLLYAARPAVDLFIPRYLLFTVPAWCLLAAGGLVRLAGWVELPAIGRLPVVRRLPVALRGSRAAAATLAVALLAIGALSLPGQAAARLPEGWQPDFQAVARVLASQQQPGDGIVYQNDHARERMALAYLMGAAAPRDILLQTPAEQLGSYDVRECAEPAVCAVPAARIWFLTTRTKGDLFSYLPEAKADFLRTGFTVERTEEFANVRLLLLVRSDARS